MVKVRNIRVVVWIKQLLNEWKSDYSVIIYKIFDTSSPRLTGKSFISKMSWKQISVCCFCSVFCFLFDLKHSWLIHIFIVNFDLCCNVSFSMVCFNQRIRDFADIQYVPLLYIMKLLCFQQNATDRMGPLLGLQQNFL